MTCSTGPPGKITIGDCALPRGHKRRPGRCPIPLVPRIPAAASQVRESSRQHVKPPRAVSQQSVAAMLSGFFRRCCLEGWLIDPEMNP